MAAGIGFEALLFDLDDTLYAYRPCHEAGLDAVCAHLEPHTGWSAAAFRARHEEVRAQLARELAGQAASHERALFFKRIVEGMVIGSGEAGRAPADVELMISSYESYWAAFLARMRPAPGALELLEALARECRLGLVSNHTTLVQLRKLERLGLAHCFSAIVTSEEVGVEKPHARIFEHALHALGVEAGRALMLGDDLEGDVLGARACGLRALLSTQFQSDPARRGDERGLDDLSQLPSRLLELA